jgi:hypothetical protein
LGPVDVRIAASHPIVDGCAGFRVTDEIYHHLHMQPDVIPLLDAQRDEGPQALLWAREVGRGRVVYDALGHDAASLAEPEHARILRRSALWALGRSDEEVRAA